MTADPRDVEEHEHQINCLLKGLCPYTGLILRTDGEGLPGTLSCDMCDCFGYRFNITATIDEQDYLMTLAIQSDGTYDCRFKPNVDKRLVTAILRDIASQVEAGTVINWPMKEKNL